jgi:hypothetical protein
MSDQAPKYVGLFKMIKIDAGDSEEARAWKIVKEKAAQLESYWRYQCPDWEYRVRGYVMRYDGYVDPPQYARTAINTFWEEHGDADYPINDWIAWGWLSKQYCGLADLGGNRAAVNSLYESQCNIGTIAHEDGHSNNYGHSGTVKADGTTTEYGDDSCIMGGGGATLKGLNSPKVVQLNFDTLMERHIVESSEQVLLSPIEHSWHTLHPNQYQHCVLRRQGYDDVYLSLRADRGVPFPYGKTGSSVYVHTFTKKVTGQYYPVNKSKLVRTLTPQENLYPMPNGWQVKYHEYDHDSQTARISILTSNQEPMPDDLPMPVGFPTPLDGALVTPAFDGVWYNKRTNGQGLDIHIHESQQMMVLYWYTFDTDGHPIYYIGVSSLDGNKPLKFDIRTTTDGTWANPTTYQSETIGEGLLYFFDETRGVFVYRTLEYGNGSIEITPAAPLGHTMWDGAWYDKEMNGSGFTVQLLQDVPTADGLIDVLSMYWYSFDPHGNQIWFMCTGQWSDEHGYYDLNIYEVLGGRFRYPTKVVVSPIGTAHVVLREAISNQQEKDEIEFTYQIDSSFGISETGKYTLERLF